MGQVRHPQTEMMLAALRDEKVETWFDLGLFLDRLREERPVPAREAPEKLEDFQREIAAGVGFLTFDFGVDGVSVEIAKYALALRRLLPDVRVHYIAGHFADLAGNVIDADSNWHEIETIRTFESWSGYRDFFSRKLERGGPLYNELIGRLWNEAQATCRALGELVEAHDIRLLYLVNTNSNPGNVALALATVLVSEFLQIPVINNCHDFYWERGASKIQREVEETPKGPRDHFYTNAHVGEIFSLLEMLYPWESRSWVAACINAAQLDALCTRFGFSPANLAEIGTAVDTDRFARPERRRARETWSQVAEILRDSRSRLRARAVADVLEGDVLDPESRRPLLIAARTQANVDFVSGNVVLLQPTRIIPRKTIELDFKLIEKLFDDAPFREAFRSDPQKKLTLLVTGPVALGNEAYLERIVRNFEKLVTRLDAEVRDRVYLGFLFSEFDRPEFRAQHEEPVDIPDLYGIASLVVLPSETEGRGLPIIEAAACGVPIFARHYEPAEVFSSVIGLNHAQEDRLDVIVFSGSRMKDSTIEKVRDRLLFPDLLEERGRHNRQVVERRFSMNVLERDLGTILSKLHLQLQPAASRANRARAALASFEERVRVQNPVLVKLLAAEHREYLSGFGRMGFMLMLKSLIDPSYFRIEEQRQRGMAFEFARTLMRRSARTREIDLAAEAEFYGCVESLFLEREGEMPIRIDHSLAYRHRNRIRYPYRELTPQELTGVIVSIHHDLFGSPECVEVSEEMSPLVADWAGMVARCYGGGRAAIDDRDFLRRRLEQNVPIAIFPGKLTEHELEVFVLQTVRLRLGLGIHDEIPREKGRALERLAPITLIERGSPMPGDVSAESLARYLAERAASDKEFRLLSERDLCRVVASEQRSVGIDFRLLGGPALEVLRTIREAGGFIIGLCEQAAVTTDGADIERFHIGRATDATTANMLGIPLDSGYVQWAPAGLRPTLAYPTPVQTAKSLSETLHGPRFARLCKRFGEKKVHEALREDAITCGSSVESVLDRLASRGRARPKSVAHEALNGVYDDGCPWSGVIASVPRSLRYEILSSKRGNQTVPDFVRRFDRSPRRRARIAWNGGYILNAELVGKLGLAESYIGSPLGLIIERGTLVCPPLFDKPAFLVGEDRSLSIRRVSCAGGVRMRAGRSSVELGPERRNLADPGDTACFYDLLYDELTLPGDGRSIVRLVGHRIMEIVETKPDQHPPVLPVGLVVSFPAGGVPRGWEPGRALAIDVLGLSGIANAVEAGPLLLDDGEVALDMEREGWKTRTSIQTQAARLDFLDMRGPKIAIGLDERGVLAVLAVNGRIRESVGATHADMAEILAARGMQSAMGFDPGGSASLVVGGEILNISPYNHDYERNVHSLPPEPRGVANAVVGY